MVCRWEPRFRFQDDLLDILGEESAVGKTLGIDICKGKLTLPMIHFLRTRRASISCCCGRCWKG